MITMADIHIRVSMNGLIRESANIVIAQAAKINHCSKGDVLGKHKYANFVNARRMISAVLLKHEWGLSKIARLLGRNHATIIHHRERHNYFMQNESDYKAKYNELYEAMQGYSFGSPKNIAV